MITATKNQTLWSFYEEYQKPSHEKTTIIDCEVQLRHFDRYWAKQHDQRARLCDLSPAAIFGAMNMLLKKGREKGTADKLRRVLMSLWNLAAVVIDDVYPPAPKSITPLRGNKYDPCAWSVDEFGRILEATDTLSGQVGRLPASEFFRPLLWTVYNSGLRISTAMAIRWDWVDLDGRRLHVPPEQQKDDEGKLITLLPETVDGFKRIRQQSPCDEVFGDWPYDRGPRSSWAALTKRLKRCIVGAGLCEAVDKVPKRWLWHKLRRTFATEIYAKSHDIELVRDMLGHSSIAVTMRYIDTTRIGRKTQADLLTTPTHQLMLFPMDDAS